MWGITLMDLNKVLMIFMYFFPSKLNFLLTSSSVIRAKDLDSFFSSFFS